MGKVKFIIESDFLKTNSIMKFAIEKGAKIEDYQQTLTEAETNGVRRWLKGISKKLSTKYSTGVQMKKLIDFETLKANCGHKTAFGDCYTSTFSGHVKICNKDTCLIWNSLPDVPEPDQSKDTERLNTKEQPTYGGGEQWVDT